MALARKGTRLITVDGVRYRWVLAPDDEPGMAIVVERAQDAAQRMVTWVDYGAVVTPRLVAGVIRLGLRNGWTPGQRASQVVFRISHADVLALGGVLEYDDGRVHWAGCPGAGGRARNPAGAF